MKRVGRVFARRWAVIALCALPVLVAAAEPPVQPVELATARQLRAALQHEHGKVVALNFWGTWCSPCLREIPELVQLEHELSPQGMVLIGLAMDEPASFDAAVRAFHALYFPGFRSYSRNEPEMDTIASVVDPAWNEILPTTYLIGRDGAVVRRIQGRQSADQFRAALQPLLLAK